MTRRRLYVGLTQGSWCTHLGPRNNNNKNKTNTKPCCGREPHSGNCLYNNEQTELQQLQSTAVTLLFSSSSSSCGAHSSSPILGSHLDIPLIIFFKVPLRAVLIFFLSLLISCLNVSNTLLLLELKYIVRRKDRKKFPVTNSRYAMIIGICCHGHFVAHRVC